MFDLYLGPAEKEVMQTEPVQVIVLILAETPKTTPGTLPNCPLVEILKGLSVLKPIFLKTQYYQRSSRISIN